MVEDMQLRGYAKRTQTTYTRAVRQLENYWHLPAEEIGEQQVRDYFLYCRHYGFMSPNAKVPLSRIRELICALYEIIVKALPAQKPRLKKPWICRSCGGLIRWIGFIPCNSG